MESSSRCRTSCEILWGVGGMEQPIFHREYCARLEGFRDYCARLEGFRYNLPRFGLVHLKSRTSRFGTSGCGKALRIYECSSIFRDLLDLGSSCSGFKADPKHDRCSFGSSVGT